MEEERKTRKVLMLGEDVEYVFTNCTPREALEKMIYFISCTRECDPKIEESLTGRTLWFKDNGNIYATVND